jgi:hypothetical protein
MAQELEKLIVSLEANLKQYERELARVQGITTSRLRSIEKQAQASANRIEAGFARVGKAFGAMLTVGAFLKLADQVQESVKAIADLNEAAQKAGVSIEDLQRFMAAGVGAGLNQEQIVNILAKFNRTLGEAKAKGAEVGSTTAEFLKLADAIAAANTPAEQAVLIQQNLGKAGKEAIPLLIQGSAALKKQMEDANVASDALVTAADEFYDKWATKIHNWATLFNSAIANVLVNLDIIGTESAELSLSQLQVKLSELQRSLALNKGVNIGLPIQAAIIEDLNVKIAETIALIAKAQAQVKPKTGDVVTAFEVGEDAEAAAKAIDKVAKAAAAAGDDLLDLDKGLVEIDQEFLKQIELADQLEGTFKDTFGSLIEGARDGKLGLKEVLGVLDDLSAKLLKMASEKIFELLFAGAFGPSTSATSSGTGILAGLLGRAGGGPVSAGTPYMVGEKGPELFVPKQSGSIVPGGGGGMAPIINITNMPGVASTQTRSNRGGQEVVDIVNQVVESRFPDLLNRNAGLIGAKPASRRTF